MVALYNIHRETIFMKVIEGRDSFSVAVIEFCTVIAVYIQFKVIKLMFELFGLR